MGIFRDISLLKITEKDQKKYEVSVCSDLKDGDVRAVDIMRPNGWGLVDVYGIPLRTKPSNFHVPEARYSRVRNPNELKNSTGWHGSLSRFIGVLDYKRHVCADAYWSADSAVVLVGNQADI